MSREAVLRARQQKNAMFKSQSQSPLTEAQQATFNGLNYFDYQPELALEVIPERFAAGDVMQIMTTQNTIRNYERFGRFTFVVDDTPIALTIYRTPHGYFLPFVDASPETYPAGRYLDLAAPDDDGVFQIDFNRAYNPLCAYNDRWDCPITPAENRLSVEIQAGEKVFHLEGK